MVKMYCGILSLQRLDILRECGLHKLMLMKKRRYRLFYMQEYTKEDCWVRTAKQRRTGCFGKSIWFCHKSLHRAIGSDCLENGFATSENEIPNRISRWKVWSEDTRCPLWKPRSKNVSDSLLCYSSGLSWWTSSNETKSGLWVKHTSSISKSDQLRLQLWALHK